ncbi:MAG: rRNA maturation RNase YbeY [Rhodopirellula sp.]|nr:rRNA maturation RNase YbeY [Rhodopirellula sp.]
MAESSIPNNEVREHLKHPVTSSGMYEIDVANHQECLTIDEEFVRNIVRQTLESEQVTAATISVAIVDNAQIHQLNRKFLNHDYETDVLSFLLEESCDLAGDQQADAPRGTGKTIDGEIIVSTEMAIDMAADYAWDAIDELTLYIVHGLLHLCGYDDLTAEELPIMRERECHVFEVLGRPKPTRDSSDQGHVNEEQPLSETVSPEQGDRS